MLVLSVAGAFALWIDSRRPAREHQAYRVLRDHRAAIVWFYVRRSSSSRIVIFLRNGTGVDLLIRADREEALMQRVGELAPTALAG